MNSLWRYHGAIPVADGVDIEYYMQFVEALDQGGEFEVNDFEAGFLESLLTQRPRRLSPKRYEVLKGMVRRYLHEEMA